MLLQPDRAGPALLDGGWWPRTDDPAAELPGLILALDKRHGRITRIMLGTAGWDGSRPHRLRVDGPAGARFVPPSGSSAQRPRNRQPARCPRHQRRARQLGLSVRLAAPSPAVANALHSTGLERSFTISQDPFGALIRVRTGQQVPLRFPAMPALLGDPPPSPRAIRPHAVPYVGATCPSPVWWPHRYLRPRDRRKAHTGHNETVPRRSGRHLPSSPFKPPPGDPPARQYANWVIS
jgi:hypothetical protein